MDEQNYPEHLYRYRAFDEERLKEFFTKNVLYFPSPGLFNDPFDCSPLITFLNATPDDRDTYIESMKEYLHFDSYSDWIANKYDIMVKFRNNDPDLIQIILKALEEKTIPHINNDYGIISFSHINDDILMWSHYSESHKGLCLIFDYGILCEPHMAKGIFYKVNYCDTLPTLCDYNSSPEHKFFENIFTRKACHWEYEREWRLITTIHNNDRIRSYPPEMLTGIIFGCKMKEEHEALIREWIAHRDPKPQLYKARINNERYALDIIPIE